MRNILLLRAKGALQKSQLFRDAAQKLLERPQHLQTSCPSARPADTLLQAQCQPTRRDTLEKIKILRKKQEEAYNKSIREMAKQERSLPLIIFFFLKFFLLIGKEQGSHSLMQDVLIHIIILTSHSQAHQNNPGRRSDTV